jgi:23S rRNA (uridine2552-2'-O)-methyltransferase
MFRKSKKEEYYSRRAKEEGYPARSVYKLKEIDEKYKIFRSGNKVLDLGCAPGSWLAYIFGRVGIDGLVVGVDSEEIKIPLAVNMRFVRKNVMDLKVDDFISRDRISRYDLERGFDVVVSDLAPKTTGVKMADIVNSVILADKALSLAKMFLRPGGNFVCKVFEGELAEEFFREAKKNFEFAKRFRPKAVSKESKEFFVVGLGMKMATA